MKKVLFLLPLLFVFSGCATNNYAKFYHDYTGGENILENPNVVLPTIEPKLVQGTNLEDDNIQMVEKGYILLGESSFVYSATHERDAIKQAKNLCADTVITYKTHFDTPSGSVPITMPNTQTSHHSGAIYGSGGGYGSYSGTSTTYGTQTMNMPYNYDRFEYKATYWIKMKSPTLGVFCGDLTDELRRKVESNKGVYIVAVVKDSPAFHADLLNGDIVLKFNKVRIKDSSHFSNLISENKGQQIQLEIFRDGNTILKQIQMNLDFRYMKVAHLILI